MAVKLGSMEILLGLNVKAFDKALKGIGRKFGRMGRQLQGAGQSLTMGLTAPLSAIGIVAAKTAINWETSFANVRKTVAGTEEELQALSRGIRNMSLELPVAAGELASIAEEAGRLGIARGGILKFTDTVVRLAETSTLSSEEAAISLARLIKQTSASSEDVRRLATSLTVLGSEFETNESSIAEMAQRLSVTGDVIGLSAHEILGFSAAMSAAGIQAEGGGTAMGDVFIKIASAVSEGGGELDKFAKIAGKTSKDFKRQFETDASGALVAFVRGLKNVKDSGGSVFQALEDIGLSGKRQRLVLLALQKDTDGLVKALDRSKTAWVENTALQDLSEKKFKTTGAEIQKLINQVTDIARELGDALFPAIQSLVDIFETSFIPTLKEWVESFKALEPSTKAMIIVVAALAAGIGPLLFMLGQLAFMIQAVAGAMTLMAAHPVVALLVGLTALVGGMAAYNAIAAKMKGVSDDVAVSMTEQEQRIHDLTDAMATFGRIKILEKALAKIKEEASKTGAKADGLFEAINRLSEAGDRLGTSFEITAELMRLRSSMEGLTEAEVRSQLAMLRSKQIMDEYRAARAEAAALYSKESEEIALKNRQIALEEMLISRLIKISGDHNSEIDSSKDRLREYREELTALRLAELENIKTKLDLSEATKEAADTIEKAIEDQKPLLDENLTVWEEWGRRMKEIIDETSAAFRAFTFDVMTEFSEGFGRALASTIVAGESFGKTMQNLWKQIASTIISRLISMGVQLLLYSLIEDSVATNSARTTISKAAGKTYAEAFSSVISGLPFPANVIAAPIVASVQSGIVLATGNSIAAAAQGGILTGPQIVLAGEAGPEAIIPLDRLGEFTGGRQTVNLYMDSELVSEAVIEGMPSVLEARLGGI